MTVQSSRAAGDPWHKVIELTDNIQMFAVKKDWASMEVEIRRRERLLQQLLRRGIPEALRSEIADRLREIKEKDEETVRLVQKNKGLLEDKLALLQAQRKRVTDYISNSR